jgi:transcriptional regulator with GAF, ATPase, and Fis domain
MPGLPVNGSGSAGSDIELDAAAFGHSRVHDPLSRLPLAVGRTDRHGAMSTDQHADPPLLDPRVALTELARLSFEDTSLEAMLQRLAELAQRMIPRVAEASVTLISHDKATSAAYTGRLALDLDESQYGRGYGPCLEAAVGEELREITDAREEARWPDYARICVERGALSSLSVPLPVREAVHGALNLYAIEAGAFDDRAKETARTFASYAAVAVRNMHLYLSIRELAEHMNTAMQSRAVIEQAKGIVMSQRRCDANEAFNLLAAASQRSNRKLRDIAAAIVDGITRPPAKRN